MDINELPSEQFNRHPWELSRRDSILCELSPFLQKTKKNATFIDLGAGDQFFDDALLAKYKGFHAVAVDIGYSPSVCEIFEKQLRHQDRIRSFSTLEEVSLEQYEFALMMDSLEYMVDEAACLHQMAELIRPDGFLFLAVPAFPLLDSYHDVVAKNLRRYTKKHVRDILREVPELELVFMHYFYTTLFMVRLVQKLFGMEVAASGKLVSGWRHSENHIVTKIATAVLNIDFAINRFLKKIGLSMPGLSLAVICRKVGGE